MYDDDANNEYYGEDFSMIIKYNDSNGVIAPKIESNNELNKVSPKTKYPTDNNIRSTIHVIINEQVKMSNNLENINTNILEGVITIECIQAIITEITNMRITENDTTNKPSQIYHLILSKKIANGQSSKLKGFHIQQIVADTL